MYRFGIWAPRAKNLAIKVNGAILQMHGPDDHGWWRIDVIDAEPGRDYGFQIDDDPKWYPDPRSQWQPNGVHGLSRIYDQSAFSWTDNQFCAPPLPGAIIYELHVGTFTEQGTLDSAISKLKYLLDLGITHVELMPVASFAGHHGWGYDGVGLFAVQESYGGPEALKRFVNAAHEEGMAVLLDVVYNHFGPVGNYTEKFGPYLIESHHTPWGGAVNLEGPWSNEVRRFFCDNALTWMREFHIDGLRIDAVHAFVDRSAIHFLERLAQETELLAATLHRPLALIAESDLNDPRIVTPRECGGFGMDAQWSDDFHHALFSVLSPGPNEGYYADFGSLGQLAKALKNIYVYDGLYSRYRKRMHGRPIGNLSRHRFLGYIQNHDQVGNRAVGDRIHEVAGFHRAKIAAAIVLTSPFIPMLFQGEEWAASSPFQYFADHDDPVLARQVSEGRKREFAAFGWKPESIPDPENSATFERSKLRWDEINLKQHAEMLAWYRALINLRRSTPCLNDGDPNQLQVTFSDREKWLRFRRGAITVICNLDQSQRPFLVPEGGLLVLGSRDGLPVQNGTAILPADTVVVIRTPMSAST